MNVATVNPQDLFRRAQALAASHPTEAEVVTLGEQIRQIPVSAENRAAINQAFAHIAAAYQALPEQQVRPGDPQVARTLMGSGAHLLALNNLADALLQQQGRPPGAGQVMGNTFRLQGDIPYVLAVRPPAQPAPAAAVAQAEAPARPAGQANTDGTQQLAQPPVPIPAPAASQVAAPAPAPVLVPNATQVLPPATTQIAAPAPAPVLVPNATQVLPPATTQIAAPAPAQTRIVARPVSTPTDSPQTSSAPPTVEPSLCERIWNTVKDVFNYIVDWVRSVICCLPKATASATRTQQSNPQQTQQQRQVQLQQPGGQLPPVPQPVQPQQSGTQQTQTPSQPQQLPIRLS